MQKFNIEMTDTFGGEANYSWVTRKEIEAHESISDLALVRRAKKELGISGVPCRMSNYGDTIELRLVGTCVVVFISLVY